MIGKSYPQFIRGYLDRLAYANRPTHLNGVEISRAKAMALGIIKETTPMEYQQISVTISPIANGVLVQAGCGGMGYLVEGVKEPTFYPTAQEAFDALPQIAEKAWTAAAEAYQRAINEKQSYIERGYADGAKQGPGLPESEEVYARREEIAHPDAGEAQLRDEPVMTTKAFDVTRRSPPFDADAHAESLRSNVDEQGGESYTGPMGG